MTKTTDDAIALFESQGMADKVQLFRYRRASCINVYELDGYYDYNYGYMVLRIRAISTVLTCFLTRTD